MVLIMVVVEITTFVPYSTMKYRFSSLTLNKMFRILRSNIIVLFCCCCIVVLRPR